MSIVTIIAAHQVLNSSRRSGGGGGGYHYENDDWFLWFLGGIVVLGLCFLAYIIFVASYDRKLPPYVVNGTLHSYETKTYSKSKRVFVNVLQSDGEIRQYRTSYKPYECDYHTTTVQVPVQVSPTFNDWNKTTRYDSQLLVDVCRK